ncbi:MULTISPECIES: hypothetical protein [Streptosporangium]|uniref:Photosynthesis system II assembly factor Ycf48/Hcf136-like domain-containing protein n=1 Tax=Streptosporangium brasiliense TaxID=47480 RepID=A0ABT9RHV7_9ACTN|nr:hypothetical protein [Streptosporangium brasiliense]MDP9868859.1 hypothetical protein [Streptosporangium brasiliense]
MWNNDRDTASIRRPDARLIDSCSYTSTRTDVIACPHHPRWRWRLTGENLAWFPNMSDRRTLGRRLSVLAVPMICLSSSAMAWGMTDALSTQATLPSLSKVSSSVGNPQITTPTSPRSRTINDGTGQWHIVKGAKISSASALMEVAATSEHDVWAVGEKGGTEDDFGDPVIERWDGSRWRQATAPAGRSQYIDGVSVKAADDVWLAGNGIIAWAAHWNGSRWREHHPYRNKSLDTDILFSDVAVSGKRPWFAGNTDLVYGVLHPGKGHSKATVLSWTKSKGFATQFRTPGSLQAITAHSKTGDIWAVGSAGDYWAVGSADNRPLVLHGTDGGTKWNVSTTPPISGGQLTQVWQVAENNVWAVGHRNSPDPDNKRQTLEMPISLHYDGTSWRQVPVPVERGHLSGLTADASGTVWASGVDLAHPKQVLFLRYTAGEWAVSYSPSLPIPDQDEAAWNRVTRTSITRVPGSNTLWAVASTGADAHEKGFILRRHGE